MKKYFVLHCVVAICAGDLCAQRVYWTDNVADKIQRANTDGSGVEDLVTSGLDDPRDIELDEASQHMYWADYGLNEISRANLDGSNIVTIVSGGITPHGIALDLDAGKIYWTDNQADKIQRANLDGSSVEDLVTTGLVAPLAIAIDVTEGKIYWSDTGADKIQRANLDGTGVEDLVTTSLFVPFDLAIDPTAGKMYWADANGEMWRANLNGSGMELLFAGSLALRSIELDIAGGQFFYTGFPPGKILRASLDGSGQTELVATGLFQPIGLALLEADPCPPGAVWLDLGFALAGITGAPMLVGSGELCGADLFSISLSNARANSSAILVFGFSAVNARFKGGQLVPAPDFLLSLTTDAQGEVLIATTWPLDVPGGVPFWLQYWIADSAGPVGFSASNAVMTTTP